MFEVEDNADGMDESTQENLFKEFFSTKGDTGTGLGLLVVDRIVRNHEGKIELIGSNSFSASGSVCSGLSEDRFMLDSIFTDN